MADSPLASTSTWKPDSPTLGNAPRFQGRPAFGQSSPRFPAAPGQRAVSPLPGTVSAGRALLDDIDEHHLRVSTGSSNGNGRVSPGAIESGRTSTGPTDSNPFFGGASGRERIKASAASASSGSGRVISALQADLLQARGAINTSRGQLRLSQRAVEFLSKSNEDLKESKERLQSEGEVLSNTIARKDRLLHESASRLAFTENSLLALQTAHALALQAHKSRLKELEESTAKAEAGKTRAEGEYAALRAGMSSMSEGWRADLDWLRADLAKVELRHAKDLDEARGKYLALEELYEARESTQTQVDTTLQALQASQHSFADTYGRSLETITREVDVAVRASEGGLEKAEGVEKEMRRFTRMMKEHRGGSMPTSAGTG